jgi:isopenicillin N synthase-like dioxygenase
LNLYHAAECLSNLLLEACALSFGEKQDFLIDKTLQGDSILRVIHYKEKGSENPADLAWKAVHRDPNVLTLIMGISSEGLEIQRPDGSWLPVPMIEGAIIVSASDMLEHISNGYLKSTPHRVLNKVNTSRYAIPFFVHFSRDTILTPSTKAIEKTGGISLYPSLAVKEALESHNWFETDNTVLSR